MKTDGQITIDDHWGNIGPITSQPHYIQSICDARESLKEEICQTSALMILTNDLLMMCKSMSRLQTSSDQFAVSEVVDIYVLWK